MGVLVSVRSPPPNKTAPKNGPGSCTIFRAPAKHHRPTSNNIPLGGRPGCPVPYRVMSEELSVSDVIPAPIGVVFSAFLDSSGHTAMTGGKAQITDRVGDAFSAWDGYIQ